MKSKKIDLNRSDVWKMSRVIIKKTARKFLGEKYIDWVDDLTQEAMIKALVNQDKYNERVADLDAWLYTLTKNLCLDFMRKKKYDPYMHIDVNNAYNLSANEDYDEDFNELEGNMREALRGIGDREREILMLKYYGEYSGREIAEQLSIAEKNIPSYTMRAKAQLRESYLRIAC